MYPTFTLPAHTDQTDPKNARRRLPTFTNDNERGGHFITLELSNPGVCDRCGGPASSDQPGTRIVMYRDRIRGAPKDAGLLCPQC